MEAGFMLTQSPSGYGSPTFVLGPLRRSFWSGVKLKGQTQLNMVTYRCSRCGFLESYALGQQP